MEDEESVLELTARILKESGFTVLATHRPEKAMELAEQTAKIDLLLTDMVMPGMSGLELARKLRESRPEVKVIFMSGYGEFHGHYNEPWPSGSVFLQKPFSSEDLTNRIREVLHASSQGVSEE